MQVYMSTTTHNNDKIEEMYDRLNEVLYMTKAEENIILLKRQSAQVGEIKDGNIVVVYTKSSRQYKRIAKNK